MKETIKSSEISRIAKEIVKKAGESENDYDALEEISEILKETFLKMEILVEEILEKNCECRNCECKNNE